MKKLVRLLLCAGLLTALLALPAFAADSEQLPAKQGDFYVMVNGEYVTFPDAVPQLKDGRSFLPFVAVFERLGFSQENMTWDGSTGTITAVKPDVFYTPFNGGEQKQGDLTVQLTIGSKEITYWYAGDTTADPHGNQVQVHNSLQADVAPYVSHGRTYIPFGLVADALGYNVGWDSTVGAVIIDDVDAIMAANTETYQLMDQYQAYNRTFMEKNQKVTGSYAMDLTQTEVNEIPGYAAFTLCNSVLANGDYTMITQGSEAFQFDTDMDISFQVTSPDSEILESDLEALPAPMSVDFAMRGNLADGTMYFQSAALAQLMGQPGMENSWYKLDMAAIYDEMSAVTGMTYAQLMELSRSSLDESFSQLLPVVLKDIPLTSVSFTTSDYLEMLNTICGDSHFVKSGSNHVNTFLNESGMTGTFTLYTSGGKVNGYAMEMKADPTILGADFTLSVSMKDSKMSMAFNMDSTTYGNQIDANGVKTENVPLWDVSMELTMDGTYQTTSKQPQTEPPAGASVIDLMEIFGGLTQSAGIVA